LPEVRTGRQAAQKVASDTGSGLKSHATLSARHETDGSGYILDPSTCRSGASGCCVVRQDAAALALALSSSRRQPV